MAPKAELEALIRRVLELSTSMCMDNEKERKALKDRLMDNIMGNFRVAPKPPRFRREVTR